MSFLRCWLETDAPKKHCRHGNGSVLARYFCWHCKNNFHSPKTVSVLQQRHYELILPMQAIVVVQWKAKLVHAQEILGLIPVSVKLFSREPSVLKCQHTKEKIIEQKIITTCFINKLHPTLCSLGYEVVEWSQSK